MNIEINAVSNTKVIDSNQSEDKCLSLDSDQRSIINHALLIGLSSYAEIERLSDAYRSEVIFAQGKENSNIPENLRPIHPTGSSDTLGLFAEALRYLS